MREPRDYRLYTEAMNRSVGDKTGYFLKALQELSGHGKKLHVASIGSGTGATELELCRHLPELTILGIENQLEVIQSNPEFNHDKPNQKGFVGIRAGVEQVEFRRQSLSAVMASSVFHEILSFNDNYQWGD